MNEKNAMEDMLGNVGEVIEENIKFLKLAERIIGSQPMYFDRSRIWWMWDFLEKRWVIVDEIDLMNRIDKICRMNTVHPSVKNQLIEALKRKARLNKPKEVKKTWIQFKDTIVDIKNGNEFKANPKWFVTNPIPWKIGESEDTPVIDKLIKNWVVLKKDEEIDEKDEEKIKMMYEIIAYLILPDYPINRIFYFYGSGSNGKSKCITLMTKFVGKRNTVSSELEILMERFQSTKLYKKLLCCIGETDFSTLKKNSLLKRLTGQDMIGFEFKGKDPFDDFNYAKIIIATNSIPDTLDKTKGNYRRQIIIDFVNEFEDNKNIIEKIPKIEFENLARKIIPILKKLLKRGRFEFEGNTEEKRKRYDERANSLMRFINTECEIGFNYDIPRFEFFDEYNIFLAEHGYRKQSTTEIGKLLKEEGFNIKRKNVQKKDGNTTTWEFIIGLRIRKKE